jgi:twitching motility two-component system response regulator PilG
MVRINLTHNQYKIQQLATLLEDLHSKGVSGILYLNAEINPQRKKRSRVLGWKNGRIVYGGLNIPSSQEFAKMLGQKFKRGDLIDTAINLAMQKATDRTSARELLELLVKMRLFTWDQIESIVHISIVLTLEQVLPHAGQSQFDSTTEFNVCRGFELSQAMQDVIRRQEEWSALASLIPSMEAVPHFPANALPTISDPAVRQHLHESVDGQRSLVNIAERLDKDPLSLAQSYLHWVQAGWVVFQDSTPAQKSNMPTILAVDDSFVMQTMIKRALADHYQVLVASNATDGLNLLHHNRVALLLLDVSMPDMDGLELCRQLRSVSEFRNLPIIMLTARDGFVDKVKGQIAGTTEYLTKPFDAEKLLQVVGKYVSSGTASNTRSTSI